MEKIVLQKNYARDYSLVLETAWIAGFKRLEERFGFKNPYRPLVVCYVTEENLEIWEHEAAFKWFADWLFEQNSKNSAFIQAVTSEYEDVLKKIKDYWAQGPTSDPEKIEGYFKLLRAGLPLFSVWFYSGIDPRTPPDILERLTALRAHDEFFAQNGLYLNGCILKLGAEPGYTNLVLPSEFPVIPPPEELRRRAASGVVSVDGEEILVSTLTDFARSHPEYEFKGLFDVFQNVKEVKGQTGYAAGITKGHVRVVKNVRSMDRVVEGDILVSPMTTPDFMPAMKKAAAFVTDEGGIMCHAAIVAREMKKPCITGTKFATQVLKDGDLVEVDAEKGIVRIIEKHG